MARLMWAARCSDSVSAVVGTEATTVAASMVVVSTAVAAFTAVAVVNGSS